MAKLEANLEIKTGNGTDYLCEMTDQYTEILSTQQIVDNNDQYTQIATFGIAAGIGGNAGLRMSGARLVIVKNNSDIPIELEIATTDWKDNSNVDEANSVDLGPDSATNIRQFSYILAGNEYIVLPSTWMVSYAESHSAANAKTIDNKGGYDVNSGKLYGDTGANLGSKVDGIIYSFP